MFWRAASVPFVKRHVPRKILISVGVLLWVMFYLGRIIGHGGTGVIAALLEWLGLNWMAVLFLGFVSLLAVDLATGFGLFLPRRVAALRGWALVLGLVLSMIALVQGHRPPVVETYDVRLRGLRREMNGTVLVALSDLHLGSLLGRQWLTARVAQVMKERPDLVVLLGDLFEGHGRPQGELLPVLRRLDPPLGVWVVPGNHEFHGGRDGSLRLIEETRFRLLRNRWTEVRPGFVLSGVDDLTSRNRRGLGGDSMAEALAGRPPGATVLLSHTPWRAEQAAKAGVGLMLSGHTHGGQIWPFDYLVRLVYPLLEGIYEVDGMPVIVCRGTGTWGPRMRLWQPGEIMRVTLRALDE